MARSAGMGATGILIAINVVVYLTILIGTSINSGFISYFVLNPSQILQGQYLFTLITSMFAHAELFHLIMNMVSLLFIGALLENLIGRKRFLTVYLASGIAASILFIYLEVLFGQNLDINALGASGAIFGIAGTLVMITPKLPVYVMLIPLPLPLWFGILLLMALLWVFSVVLGIPIANTAHLGGLMGGLLYGLYLRRKYGRKITMVNKLLGIG